MSRRDHVAGASRQWFLENVEYGSIASLRNIPASNCAEIRFIVGWDAMTRYGSDHVACVIQI